MKTFITSDTHFGDNIIEKMGRPGFDSVDDWNSYMLDRINTRVGRADRLVIAGDFTSGPNPGFWRQQIKCKHVILVRGNHDRWAKCQNVFGGNAREYLHLRGGENHMVVTHYPMAFWEGSHHGWCHAYGHCHAQRESTLDEWMPTRRSIDVGVDNYRRLFGSYDIWNLNELFERLTSNSGHDKVEFYTEN